MHQVLNIMCSYAFDVDKTSQAFTNRRVFAYIDTGIPDGIQVDKAGNVYSSCGDGVHVRKQSINDAHNN
jgi:sugar lactone lactonase YvrE